MIVLRVYWACSGWSYCTTPADLAWTFFSTVFAQGVYTDHVAWEQIHSSSFFFFSFAHESWLSFSLNMGIVLFGFMFLKIKTTLEWRNGPSHLSYGSVQSHVSRKFIHQLVCGVSLQVDWFPCSSLEFGLWIEPSVVFEFCIHLPLTSKCFSFSIALFPSPLFLDDPWAWHISDVKMQAAWLNKSSFHFFVL